MTRQKDFKRLVRARMGKTGESYTAARAQVLAQPPASRTRTRTAPAAPPVATKPTAAPPPDLAALAGTSNETLKARTGCTWERWVHALDRRGAAQMSHREIATLVREKYHVDGWWAQTVTMGYERIKGLRARGQRRDGTYEASKSKTFPVPVERLFEAWSDARLRRRWLDGVAGRVRTATPLKSMRLDGRDRTIIAVGFVAKGPSRSMVALQHMKLPDKEAEVLKGYWDVRLKALAAVLAS